MHALEQLENQLKSNWFEQLAIIITNDFDFNERQLNERQCKNSL